MKVELAAALTAFGVEAPRFISESENAVYEVRREGQRAALRLHRPGYQGRGEIWSELWWMRAMAEAGLPVPGALTTPEGALVAKLPGGRLASMVSWVAGVPMSDETARPDVFHAVGALLAQLHDATDALALPAQFARHAWDTDGLMGSTPLWGRFWENPTLSAGERVLVLRARDRARTRLDAFRTNGGDFGLIHADPIRGNVFVDDDRVTLIDFDDAGFGFRAYDLAVLMTQNEDAPNAHALQAAAVAGYRSRRAFSAEAEALLPLLIMARRMASMGWIVPRAGSDAARHRFYAERALAAVERFLSD